MFHEQVKELASEPFRRLTGVKPETFAEMVEALATAVGTNVSQADRASSVLRTKCC